MILDNFYNGRPFDLGLRRYAPAIYEKELRLAILPLREDAPIFLPHPPNFSGNSAVVALARLDVIPRTHVTLQID